MFNTVKITDLTILKCICKIRFTKVPYSTDIAMCIRICSMVPSWTCEVTEILTNIKGQVS